MGWIINSPCRTEWGVYGNYFSAAFSFKDIRDDTNSHYTVIEKQFQQFQFNFIELYFMLKTSYPKIL